MSTITSISPLVLYRNSITGDERYFINSNIKPEECINLLNSQIKIHDPICGSMKHLEHHF